AEAVTGRLDAAAAFAQRDYMTSDWNDAGAQDWVEQEGIELVRGSGRLAGERTVAVKLADGGRRTLTARRAGVLAVGRAPAIPPAPGPGGARPRGERVGSAAAPLGCELSQLFRRRGSQEVTVVIRGERLLAREEPFAGREVKDAFEAEGIAVRTRTQGAAVRGAR